MSCSRTQHRASSESRILQFLLNSDQTDWVYGRTSMTLWLDQSKARTSVPVPSQEKYFLLVQIKIMAIKINDHFFMGYCAGKKLPLQCTLL